MEYALHSGIMVDRRMDSHGITLDRMSINIRKITLCSQRDVAKALSFRGVNGTYVLMESWAVQAETIQIKSTLARVLELGAPFI